MSPPGRPKGESLSAQHEGFPVSVVPGEGRYVSAQTFLAFDYGVKRTGVATGNTVTRTAQPLTTIHAEGDARFPAIDRLIREWAPQALVVGVPFHPDGAEHENTRRARRFARQLQGRFGLPVHEVDERYSTVEVLAYGARDADAAAAALLLEQYFSAEGMAAAVAGLP